MAPTTAPSKAGDDWAPVSRVMGGPEVTVTWTSGPGRNTRIIDVRGPGEFHGPLGHVTGSELVPLQALPTAAQSWARDEEIVVVCRSGARSLVAANLMEQMGFGRVASMAGGMIQWGAQGLPVGR
jgi:rhodanese-related sulfurtransferase